MFLLYIKQCFLIFDIQKKRLFDKEFRKIRNFTLCFNEEDKLLMKVDYKEDKFSIETHNYVSQEFLKLKGKHNIYEA